MASIPEYKIIFGFILDALERGELTRRELINTTIDGFCLSDAELCDRSMAGIYSRLRSSVGIVINDMEKKGIIELRDGNYRRTSEKIIAVRLDECEEEILRLVEAAPRSKAEIRDALVKHFGTDTTPSVKDDNHLFTYIGQALKTLTADGTFTFDGGKYSASPEKSAYIKSRTEMLDLKAAFISRVHSKGGEFFELYFLNLIKKHLLRAGKTVIEGYVSGGSDDGGIDGVVRTQDSLGFRETIMIQTKNRTDTVTETDVRGFYGAVCAKRGTRGIFATISDFHPMARKLLDSLDDLVGIDGDKIFTMACDTSYGIKREGDRLIIDKDII